VLFGLDDGSGMSDGICWVSRWNDKTLFLPLSFTAQYIVLWMVRNGLINRYDRSARY
jgi:hypothetical protein